MPEIGTLHQVEQGTVHIVSVESGTVHPAQIEFRSIVYPTVRYEGEYTVTPSTETQTLATNGKVLLDDITVNPIPNNYGLITWNGSVLTVS